MLAEVRSPEPEVENANDDDQAHCSSLQEKNVTPTN